MENVLIFTGVLIGLFFLLRSVNIWYWKIDEQLQNQREIITLLKDIKQNTAGAPLTNEQWRKNINGETSVNDPATFNSLLRKLK